MSKVASLKARPRVSREADDTYLHGMPSVKQQPDTPAFEVQHESWLMSCQACAAMPQT